MVWVARAGGKEDPVRVECADIFDRDLVVTADGLFHAHLSIVLDEVVGEGVEIVDDEHHGCAGIELLGKMQNRAGMAR